MKGAKSIFRGTLNPLFLQIVGDIAGYMGILFFFIAILVDFVVKYGKGQGQFSVFTIYFGTVFCVEDTACGYPNG
jgi:hypothetical protein